MTAPFNHPAGVAAIEKLRSLPEPARSRMLALVNRRLYPRGDEPLGFEPTEEERVMAEQFAGAIRDMVKEAELAAARKEVEGGG